MISIERSESKVVLKVNSKLSVDRPVFLFDWDCGKEAFAELLAQQLRDRLGDELERIRKEAYNKGFDDHKKRQKRDDWFKRWW